MKTRDTYDAVVIGAGVFGAWTAYHLQRAGQSVLLLDAYGAANSRASSGGESRVIRMGYGADGIYTRWAMRSLKLWEDFFQSVQSPLFHRTGVLWLARAEDAYSLATIGTFQQTGVRFESMTADELARRYPQISFSPEMWGIFEPDSGVLMARRAVQKVVEEAIKDGLAYMQEAVAAPKGNGPVSFIETRSGLKISAETFIFACGPWLPQVFPELLQDLIHPTRQEVFFFGTGDRRYAPPLMPVWIDFTDLVYGIPDLENRGFKMAIDRHGPTFDPETGERVVTAEGLKAVRQYLSRRLPDLRDAPVVETRVCQYENTSNGDFLIDRHPDFDNIWLVGGGSGHGFKHGPVLGEYLANLIMRRESAIEARFSLETKTMVHQRAVY